MAPVETYLVEQLFNKFIGTEDATELLNIRIEATATKEVCRMIRSHIEEL